MCVLKPPTHTCTIILFFLRYASFLHSPSKAPKFIITSTFKSFYQTIKSEKKYIKLYYFRLKRYKEGTANFPHMRRLPWYLQSTWKSGVSSCSQCRFSFDRSTNNPCTQINMQQKYEEDINKRCKKY